MERIKALRGAVKDAAESYSLRKAGKETHISTALKVPVYKLAPCPLDVPELIILSHFPEIEKKAFPAFRALPEEQACAYTHVPLKMTLAETRERLQGLAELLRPVLSEKEFHFAMQRVIRWRARCRKLKLFQEWTEQQREKQLEDLGNWYWAGVYNEKRRYV